MREGRPCPLVALSARETRYGVERRVRHWLQEGIQVDNSLVGQRSDENHEDDESHCLENH